MALRFIYDATRQAIQNVIAPQLQELRGEIVGLRGEMHQLEKRIDDSLASVRSEVASVHRELSQEIAAMRNETQQGLASMRNELAGTNKRIDDLAKRIDETLNVRERLAAPEAAMAHRTQQ